MWLLLSLIINSDFPAIFWQVIKVLSCVHSLTAKVPGSKSSTGSGNESYGSESTMGMKILGLWMHHHSFRAWMTFGRIEAAKKADLIKPITLYAQAQLLIMANRSM